MNLPLSPLGVTLLAQFVPWWVVVLGIALGTALALALLSKTKNQAYDDSL